MAVQYAWPASQSSWSANTYICHDISNMIYDVCFVFWLWVLCAAPIWLLRRQFMDRALLPNAQQNQICQLISQGK